MSIVLSAEEIEAITQYKMPTMQLERLRKDGFYRARMGRQGVVLERSHYEAVTRGQDAAPTKSTTKTVNLSHLKIA